MVHRREENRMFSQDLLSPLELRARSEERPQQVAYYRAEDETREWIWRGGRGEDL